MDVTKASTVVLLLCSYLLVGCNGRVNIILDTDMVCIYKKKIVKRLGLGMGLGLGLGQGMGLGMGLGMGMGNGNRKVPPVPGDDSIISQATTIYPTAHPPTQTAHFLT